MEVREALNGSTAVLSNVIKLPHAPEAVGMARRRVRAELERLSVPERVLDDLEVVVSELLGNSVRHARAIAGGVLLIGWRLTVDEVTVRVTDGGSPRSVEPREAGPMADSGRGLQIVDRLSRAWGVVDHAGGLRSVWAALSLSRRVRALTLVQ